MIVDILTGDTIASAVTNEKGEFELFVPKVEDDNMDKIYIPKNYVDINTLENEENTQISD